MNNLMGLVERYIKNEVVSVLAVVVACLCMALTIAYMLYAFLILIGFLS